MKKVILATIISAFVLASCQKHNDELYKTETVTTADATISKSGWQSVSLQGGTPNARGLATSVALLPAKAINEDVLADGIVLLFGKTDATVNTLPFSGSGTDWNYNVSNGVIDLSVSSSNSLSTASVLYVILNTAQVSALEKSGYSRNDLLNISYEKAKVLFGLE